MTRLITADEARKIRQDAITAHELPIINRALCEIMQAITKAANNRETHITVHDMAYAHGVNEKIQDALRKQGFQVTYCARSSRRANPSGSYTYTVGWG